jgi:hypothetical protein
MDLHSSQDMAAQDIGVINTQASLGTVNTAQSMVLWYQTFDRIHPLSVNDLSGQ